MRLVVQRVLRASVQVDQELVGSIERGLLVFVGYGLNEDAAKNQKAIEKISQLRIFEDSEGKMNLSVEDLKLGVLWVSQFTLLGDTRKGNRPSFTEAERPDKARMLYEDLCDRAQLYSTIKKTSVGFGKFQEQMQVELVNDGPVTLILDL